MITSPSGRGRFGPDRAEPGEGFRHPHRNIRFRNEDGMLYFPHPGQGPDGLLTRLLARQVRS